ncbi:MAG: histidinol dehydrogenase [Acidobacteriota bacterium]|nr:MAG: histidinol dehydrogenase [Acidobacteriota bacterium]
MKTYNLDETSRQEIRQLCQRNPIFDPGLFKTCEEIFEAVAERGDEALREYTSRFDGVELSQFIVQAQEFSEAIASLQPEVTEAMRVAIRNIRAFHSSQQVVEKPTEIQEGVTCWRAARAITSVGLYVPGGTAVLPSTVLMLAVPAKLAGCAKIVLCVPPRPNGSVAAEVLAAAQLAGVRQVFKVGGAQAIAAMALGTSTIPRVEKILGPGNRYVQTAKLLATFRGVAIDMVAGPSEVLVIADGSTSPEVTASDLISQAEHGADSQSVLVSTSAEFIEAVERALESQLETLPRRGLARQSLDQSFAVLASSLEAAFDFSNRYAPEHLILSIEDPREWLGNVLSAGSVFVGRWSPEVAGDYASGTNHTLPTSGAARNVSGVSMDSFVKKITFQELTAAGLSELAPTLQTLAGVESLEGHARAVEYRLKEMSEGLDE